MARPIAPDERTASAARQHCFIIERRFAPVACLPSLDPKSAHALAALIPVLGCGEEAAIVGFEWLSRARSLDCSTRHILRQIASDERHHDALLDGLRVALPQIDHDLAVQHRARRFHLSLPRGGMVLHLARIAGLDAAVCTILSRLLRPGAPVARDVGVCAVLSHIRRDECRHVMVSRAIAMAVSDRQAIRNAAAEARGSLAELLTCATDPFEALGVDPTRLLSDIKHLPDGLLPR